MNRIGRAKILHWLASNSMAPLLLAIALCFAGPACLAGAAQAELKQARLNAGYYFNSISDIPNRTDIEISLNYWLKDMFDKEAEKHNFHILPSHAFIFERMEDMRLAFDRGELDMIVAPPLLISRYFKRPELSDGFFAVLDGNQEESLLLIVNAEKNIQDIKDLPGKRLAMIKTDDLAEIFLDRQVLDSMHKRYKDIGLSILYPNNLNQIILDLYFDKADAGIVYRSSYSLMAELNPAVAEKVKILGEYPVKSKNFSFFRHGYPLLGEFNLVMHDFAKTERGRQILQVFKTNDIVQCPLEELDGIEQYYRDYLRLRRQATAVRGRRKQ